MGLRRTLGTCVTLAGIALVLVTTPSLVAQEASVAAYERLADDATDNTDGGIDWDALLATNPQISAWCAVPGASIALPVCQATDEDPSFWLTHDLWGSESAAGAPYVDHRTNADATHVLCYGHHLTGIGGMFSELQRCHEQEVFDHALADGLLWSTPESGAVHMRALCASVVDMDDDVVQHFEFADTPTLRSWLATRVQRSSAQAINANAVAQSASRAVTLVTCSSDLAGQRQRTVVTFVAE